MTSVSELAERLRHEAPLVGEYWNPDAMVQAADLIEAQAAEIARKDAALGLAKAALGFPTGKIMRPEADARRAALDAIAALANTPVQQEGGQS